MAGPSRYSVNGKAIGVQAGVLTNKLGIRNQTELDDAETLLFSDAYQYFFDLLSAGRLTIDLALLFQIHRYFLAPLYSWAGKIRTIDISKDGILFASAQHIDTSLKLFEAVLREHIPKASDTKKRVAASLAVIHCELNAIHPFREGNGRTIRLFLDLLAVRVGYNPIDWGKKTQDEYIRACIDGMVQDYSRMTKIIFAGLTRQKIESHH